MPERAAHAGVIDIPFSFPITVYWEDTDAGGVVYHASYLRFLERARTEWLRALGFSQSLLRERLDRVLVVRALRLEFLKPARLDDRLAATVGLLECRRASLRLAQRIDRGEEVLIEAEVRVACLAASDFRPRPLPDEVLAAVTDNPTYRE